MLAETPAPRVSAVVPVHNGAAFLERAVESLHTQTLADVEVVIVDDGSTDDTPAVIADLAARDRRVRPFRQEHAGEAAAANRATAEARADLIARLDADDIAVPDRLERQVAWLDANPSVAALGGSIISIDRNDRKLRVHTYPAGSVRETMSRGPAIAHPTAMMRKSVLLAVGGYRAAFRVAEDYDLWLRMAEKADLANLPEVLTYYRLHPNQATARFTTLMAQRAELARVLAKWRKDGRPDPIDQGVPIDEVMALAAGSRDGGAAGKSDGG
jgi:glycosyltransferase involved in cell wall biosynthesis